MKKKLNSKEAAKLAGVSDRRLRQLCNQGRVKNSEKVAGVWIFDGAPIVIQADRVRPSIIKMKNYQPRKEQ